MNHTPTRKDLTGKRFNRLTVIEFDHKDEKGRVYWKCRCDCGNTKVIRGNSLTSGKTKSCGCYKMENILKGKQIRSNLSMTRIGRIWYHMNERCHNEFDKGYKNYGMRGISVCEEWNRDNPNGLENFYNWSLENGYDKKLSIDRINVDGNYEPNNCRWTNNHVQSANKRQGRRNKHGYTGIICLSYLEKPYRFTLSYKGKKYSSKQYSTVKEAVESRNQYIIDHNLTEYPLQEYKDELP